MALVLADRVRDTTTTTGTGTVTLSGTAPTGYQNFSVIGDGNTCYYTINAGSQWEVGIGTYSSTGPTLARTTILASSNSGSAVDFAAGTKDVFVTYPAGKSVNYDASNNVGIGNTNPGYKLEVTGDLRLGSGGDLRLGSATGTTGSAGDSSIFSDANDMYFSTGSNTRMYIANGGNVGIGNTGPGYRLDVSSADTTAGLGYAMRIRANATAAGGALQFTDSGVTAQWGFLAATSTAVTLDCSSAGSLVFRTNGSEKVRIDSSGNVGIGTSSPVARLDLISGSARVYISNQSATGFITAVNTTNTAYAPLAVNGSELILKTGDAERARINSSGNLLVGTTTDKNRLTVTAGANTNSPTLGSAGGIAYFTNTDVSYGLNIGNSAADGRVWLQAQRTDGTATAYSLTLNEAGGNVGIGTSNPLRKLDIAGGGLAFTEAGGASRSVNWGDTTNIYPVTITGNATSGNCFLTFNTNTFGSGATERMRLLSTGKFLIGSTADADGAPFQINAASFGNGIYTARFENSDTGTGVYNAVRWVQGASGSAVGIIGTGGSTVGNASFQNRFAIGTQNNTALTFVSNDTFRGMIDGGGQFWWGAQSTIDTVSYAPFQITNALAINTNTTSGTTAVSFFNGQGSGVRVGYIGTSGSSTSYNTSSDERLKENIADAADAGALIDGIQVRQFDWKINGEHQRYGMIAQELDLVFPEAVGHGPTEEDMLAVDYSKLVPMLVKEIQSLRARVAQLEGK